MTTNAPIAQQDVISGLPQDGQTMAKSWSEAVAYCKHHLGRQDFEKVDQFESCEDLLESLEKMHEDYKSDAIKSFITKASVCVGHVRGFVTLLALSLRLDIFKTTLVWGLLKLVVELSARSVDVSSKMVSWLDQMSSDIRLFQEYEWLFDLNQHLRETLVLVYVEVIKFWSLTVKYLRKSPIVDLAIHPWSDVHSEFLAALQRIQRHASTVKESAQAISSRMLYEQHANLVNELTKRLESTNVKAQISKDEEVELPCDNIPYPRNRHFSGRASILQELHLELDYQQGQRRMNSWAIWGIGGIGKTQIALEYAYARLDNGVQAVFWVKCEGPLDIAQGFTDIATTLRMRGAVADGDHEKNRYLVLRWLQSTTTPWLMVFDNVESPDHIQKYWPAAKSGSILITSRYQVFELNPAAGGCQIPTLNEREGAELLQSLLGRKSFSTEEMTSAETLCREVDGLPLALNLLGGQIRSRRTRVQSFLQTYVQNPHLLLRADKRATKNIYYTHGVDSVWETSFERLEVDPSRLLGIMSFLAAEDIPEALFRPSSDVDLPPTLEFCSTDALFDETSAALLEAALAIKDMDVSLFRVHRLVQERYRESLSVDQRYIAFLHAARLLYEAFPKQAHGLPLRNEWPACKQYAAHVLTVCDNLKRYGLKPAQPGDFDYLARMTASCGWYFMESGLYAEFDKLASIMDQVCEDKSSLLYVQLCNNAAVAELERGHVAQAKPLMDTVRGTREKLLPPTHKDIADCYTTYGNLLMTEFASEQALNEVEQFFDKAIEIDKTHGEEHCEQIMHIRLGNNGVLYNLLGHHKKAIDYIERARDYAIKLFGRDTHFDATADYDVGKVYYDQGEWELAKKYFTKAEKIFVADNPLQSACIATQFKLACIDMRQDRPMEAIETFRKILLISKIRESSKGDCGETARILRRLSEALNLIGESDEAWKLKLEAENIRKQLQGSRFDELGDTERSYDMLLYVAFW